MIQREYMATEKSHRHKNYMCILWVDILNRLLSFIKMCVFFFYFLFFVLLCGNAHIRNNVKNCGNSRKTLSSVEQFYHLSLVWVITSSQKASLHVTSFSYSKSVIFFDPSKCSFKIHIWRKKGAIFDKIIFFFLR